MKPKALLTTSRRRFLKTLGAAAIASPFVVRNLFAEPPSQRLRNACFGTGGQAWSDLTAIANSKNVEIVAVCDVDLNRMSEAKKRFPNARYYQDWRELLDKEAKNIDSVNVSTPDHMHAPIGISAMQLGKHVYGQKPLARDIFEVRRMVELSQHKEIVTQMGIQCHSDHNYRMAVHLVQDGVIGKIKEVHSWCNKSWGDTSIKPERTDAVPEGFDWNLWLGVCADRPFLSQNYYHPGNWRKRLDFGTGTLGDMGCHLFDPVFESIGLTSALSVHSVGPAPNEWNWALNGQVHYTFKGTDRTAGETLPLTWYDGTSKPRPEVVALVDGDDFPFSAGSLLIGTEGVLLLPHVDHVRLYPKTKFQEFKFPHVPGFKHYDQFVEACRGNDRTTTNFDYAGPLTEAILLGGICSHFPNVTLDWNSSMMQFSLKEANRFVRRDYRQGWKINGLG